MNLFLVSALHGDEWVVVPCREGAFSSTDHKATLGLRLGDPRVRECPPAGFELGQAVNVSRDGDAMLINLQPCGLIDDAGHFDGLSSALEPSAQCGAVASVILERPPSRCFFIEPTRRLLGLNLSRSFF